MGIDSHEPVPRPMSAQAINLLHHLFAAGQQLTAQQRLRARMTPHDYAALQHLTRFREGLTPGQLCGMLGITSGSTTKLIDRLEARRLVRRVPHPRGDRRTSTIRATPGAMRLIRRDLEQLLRELPSSRVALTEDQRDAIARLVFLAAQPPGSPSG